MLKRIVLSLMLLAAIGGFGGTMLVSAQDATPGCVARGGRRTHPRSSSTAT